MRQDRVPINMSVASEPLLLIAYIEDCRIKLWDHAFKTYFKGLESFKKGDDFDVFLGCDLVVRKVLFRYISYLQDFIINFINSFIFKLCDLLVCAFFYVMLCIIF